MSRSTPYHHGNLPEALVHAARALIAEKGLAGLTLRATARRAGVSHNAPYRHFPDKDALVAAVAEQGFRELHAGLSAGDQAAGEEPVQRLVACGETYLGFALEDPDRYRLMFGPQLRKENHPGVQGVALSAFQCLLHVVESCVTAGVVVAVPPPMQIALFLWAQVHGLAMLAIDGQLGSPQQGPAPGVVEMAQNLALRGMLTSEAWDRLRA